MENRDQQSLDSLLSKYKIRPDKDLGQNFLTDPTILAEIVAAAEVTNLDTVLEIGAGLGHLTKHLAQAAKKVVAVELDKQFIPALEDRLGRYQNVSIVQGNILELNPAKLIQENEYLVAANIPYYITSSIIRNLLESELKPKRIILTIQHEVAQRVCSNAGQLSILALSVRMYGNPILVNRIPAEAFFPTPKVDSAVIRIDLFPEPLLPPDKRIIFFSLIKAGFQHKRKTLRNSLSKGLGWSTDETGNLLSSVGIDPQRRAQTLTIPEWLELTDQYDNIRKV